MDYAIFTDQSGITGVPNVGDLKIFEKEIAGNAFNKSNYIQYEWMKAGFSEFYKFWLDRIKGASYS